ncbi:signal peptidase I [Microterricola pindariensis]|uniref:Signal peptidase I n=1 Tax=Microterricola pindariensis TaxID=478010 RepID=A0ABX5AWS6_9MICO|nr:signal peptidase I [Microterricola pindariensis]PPL19383.1 signal peptidase I [Microterricola pindariensis]
MRALRSLGNIVLWLLAAAGIAAGGLWVANTAGLVQPLFVVSGSMEPGIMTGDLLFSTPKDASELSVGDVATLPSTLTNKLVTHRVIEITPGGAGEFLVKMKGDNNEFADSEEYLVTGSVLVPAAQVAGGGYFVATLSKPGVALPLAITVFALIALSLMPRPENESSLEQPACSDQPVDDDDTHPLSPELSEARA